MSFGFSVGDVILLSQLSLQIYWSLTSGRQNASRDFKGLADVLFGFQCALDHLNNVSNQMFNDQSGDNWEGVSGAKTYMRSRLDQMIRNCASTLQDLDNATKKYREGSLQDDAVTDGFQAGAVPEHNVDIRRRVTSNIWRIRWDMVQDSLRIYRDKLQAHTDAINLVLNTLLWSTTQKIQTDNKTNAEKLSKQHEQLLASNAELTVLVKSIVAATDVENNPTNSEFQRNSRIAESTTTREMSALHDTSISGRSSSRANSHSLPSHIQTLNARPLAHAAASRPKHSQTLRISSVRERSDSAGPLTVQLLLTNLQTILPTAQNPQQPTNKAEEITRWIQQLEQILDLRIWGGTSKKDNQDVVDIVVHLNEATEHAIDRARQAFYKVSRVARIDFVLGKIVKATGSVRARQQVEEFAETREGWEEGYREAGG